MTAKSTRHRTQGPVADLARACIRARWLVILTWASLGSTAVLFGLQAEQVIGQGSLEPLDDYRIGLWAILPVGLLVLLVIGAISTTAATLLTAAVSGVVTHGVANTLGGTIEVPTLGRLVAVLIGGAMVASWGVSLSLRYLGAIAGGRQPERATRETMSAGGTSMVLGLGAVGIGSAVAGFAFGDSGRGILWATACAAVVSALALATLLPALWGVADTRIEQFAARRAASTSGGLHTWAAKIGQARIVVAFLATLAAIALATPALAIRLTGSPALADDLTSVPTVAAAAVVALAALAGVLVFGFRVPAFAVRSTVTTVLAAAVAVGLAAAVFVRSDLDAVDAGGLIVIAVVTFAASATTDALLAGRLRRGRMDGDDLDVNLDRSVASGGLDSLTLALTIGLCGLALVRSGNERIATFGLALTAAALAEGLVVRVALVPAVTRILGPANISLPAGEGATVPEGRVEAPSQPQRTSAESAAPGWSLADAIEAAPSPEESQSKPKKTAKTSPKPETPAEQPEPVAATAGADATGGAADKQETVWGDTAEPQAPKSKERSQPKPAKPEQAEQNSPESSASKQQPASTTAAAKTASANGAADEPKRPAPRKPAARFANADSPSPLDDPFLAALTNGNFDDDRDAGDKRKAGPTASPAKSETPKPDTPKSEAIGAGSNGKAPSTPDAAAPNAKPEDADAAAPDAKPEEATDRPSLTDLDDVDPARLDGLPELFQRVAVLEDDNARVLERLAAGATEHADVLQLAARFSTEHRDTAIECFDELVELGAPMPDAFDTSTDTDEDTVEVRQTATAKMQVAAIDLLDSDTLHPEAAEELRWWLNRSVSQWQAIEGAGVLAETAGST